MDANPFVNWPAGLVEFLHQPGFVVTAGKGEAQERIDLGAVLGGQFLDFHDERP